MKVINLFAGPGAGKSTTAAGLFWQMKRQGFLVELVLEYAKEKVWEGNMEVMKDQIYLLAKQNRKLERLKDKVEFVITDSPLLLSAHYGLKYGQHPELVLPLTVGLFDKYENINFFIKRTKKYEQCGRIGSEKTALEADESIKDLLIENEIKYQEIVDNPDAIYQILAAITNTEMG